MIEAIRLAEDRAANNKALAVEQAAKIVEDARARAQKDEADAAEARAAYRRSELERAEAEAKADYEKFVSKKQREAEKYAEKLLENTEAAVGKIIARVTGGNS